MTYMQVFGDGGDGEKRSIMLQRKPQTRSYVVLLVFLVLGAFTYYMLAANMFWERMIATSLVVFIGFGFFEDTQTVVLTKEQISTSRWSWLEQLLGAHGRKNIYTCPLSTVYVHSERLKYFGIGRQVFLSFEDGMEVPITGHCTFDETEEHLKIAKIISQFYGLPEPFVEAIT
eukprot:m.35132 g.35132  ORF g.35132 m.35132 type:complete len:173 (+) comp8839_c0_seq2:198-716(+)